MKKKMTSKELLRESVIELVSATPVEKVTVGRICENCGVSQRTFYNYFQDKYDLISSVYTGVLEDMYAAGNRGKAPDGRAGSFGTANGGNTLPPQSFHPVITALVHNIVSHSRFYMNAVNFTGQNSFVQSVFQPLMDSTLHLIRDSYGDEITEELHYAAEFYILGCLGFMELHLLHRDVLTEEITVRVFENNIPRALAKYL